MFGYESNELKGEQTLPLTFAPESIEVVKREIAARGNGPYAATALKKNGTMFPVEIRARDWEHEGRKVRVAAIMDVTERKRAEEKLQYYNRRLRILHQIDRDILLARSPKEIVNAVLQHIQRLVPCWMASVALYEAATDEIVVLASEVNGDTMVRPGMHTSAPAEWVKRMLAEDYHIVENIDTLPTPISPTVRLAMEEGLRSYLAASLVAEGNLIGELMLSRRTPSTFSQEDLEIAVEVEPH